VAIDPTSPFSGGAILGDRIRMQDHATDPDVFIRSLGTRGHLGGLSRSTSEVVQVLDAMGKDVVLVETVGVGQSEFAVASMVDFFLLLMLAGAGDELQGIKRGILELADAIAVNKADGDNADRAARAAAQYRSALALLRHGADAWEPPVVTVSALEARGMDVVWSIVQDHRARLDASGGLAAKREAQRQRWFWSMLDDGLKQHFLARPDVVRLLPELEGAVAANRITPTEAAHRLLGLLDEGGRGGVHWSGRSRRARRA
jgi:LAO/AO transport system kinase